MVEILTQDKLNDGVYGQTTGEDLSEEVAMDENSEESEPEQPKRRLFQFGYLNVEVDDDNIQPEDIDPSFLIRILVRFEWGTARPTMQAPKNQSWKGTGSVCKNQIPKCNCNPRMAGLSEPVEYGGDEGESFDFELSPKSHLWFNFRHAPTWWLEEEGIVVHPPMIMDSVEETANPQINNNSGPNGAKEQNSVRGRRLNIKRSSPRSGPNTLAPRNALALPKRVTPLADGTSHGRSSSSKPEYNAATRSPSISLYPSSGSSDAYCTRASKRLNPGQQATTSEHRLLRHRHRPHTRAQTAPEPKKQPTTRPQRRPPSGPEPRHTEDTPIQPNTTSGGSGPIVKVE